MPVITLNNDEYQELSQFMEPHKDYTFVTDKTIEIVYLATQPAVTTQGTVYAFHGPLNTEKISYDGTLKVWAKSAYNKVKVSLYPVGLNLTGVPSIFTKGTSSGRTFLIQKGQLNKLRLRPQILNEHAESSREIIGTVSSGNIVGQIFKASHDNINGIDLTLESAAITIFDDFESYADSAALQVAWVASGLQNAILNTTLTNPDSSTKSMQLSGNSVNGDEWVKTITSTNYTGTTGTFRFLADREYSDFKIRIFIGDGTNTKSASVVQSSANIWNTISISEEQMTEDGAGTTDVSAITKVGFRMEERRSGAIAIVDTMVTSPAPGSVELKIYDLGATLPESGVTKLSDGTQYEKIGDIGISGIQESSYTLNLLGGFRNYHIDNFVCGPALEIPDNVTLNKGNYYALTINYIDTNVSVYGPNPLWDNYYENGYSFTAPDESTAITETGTNEDIMFAIYSTQDVYMNGFQVFFSDKPNGNARATFYIEDMSMLRSSVFIVGIRPPQSSIVDFKIPSMLEKGGKLELEYNDDFTDNVENTTVIFLYYYEDQAVNG